MTRTTDTLTTIATAPRGAFIGVRMERAYPAAGRTSSVLAARSAG